jgi:hypothetical protein
MSSSDVQSGPTTPLIAPSYADTALQIPWYRRRRRLVPALIILALGLASIALYRMRDDIAGWYFLYLQHKCLTYTSSSERIVYSDLPQDVKTLSGSSDEYTALNSSTPAIAFMPSEWVAFRRAFYYGKSNPNRGTNTFIFGPNIINPVLFLGERKTPAGERRLVCVTFGGFGRTTGWDVPPQPTLHGPSGSKYETFFPFSTMTVGSSRTPPVLAAHGYEEVLTSIPPKNLRFFAGQPDPKDFTHFTIRYELSGQSGQIEVFLAGNGSLYFKSPGPLQADIPRHILEMKSGAQQIKQDPLRARITKP